MTLLTMLPGADGPWTLDSLHVPILTPVVYPTPMRSRPSTIVVRQCCRRFGPTRADRD